MRPIVADDFYDFYKGPWEVQDNRPAQERDGAEPEFYVERATERGTQRAAVCWNYGLACVIEAALNWSDGTVE